MNFRARTTLVTIAVAFTAAALGAAVMMSGIHLKLRALHGIRLAAFVFGVVMFVAALYLAQRALRRRARLNAIADLLPRYRVGRPSDYFPSDEGDLDGDFSEHIHGVRGEMRAATRALLVSLEDEMRRETVQVRRSTRPACRRVRLRKVGRAQPRRRHMPARMLTTIFS